MTASRTRTTPPAPGAPATSTVPERPGEVRLALAAAFYSGPLDGAWWPRSRDLQREARVLVDEFPADRGRVHRLLVSPPDWDRTGARVQSRRGAVKVGMFPRDDAAHVVVLTLHDGTRLRLLVVAAATPTAAARSLMEQASATGNRRDAATLIAAS